MDIITKGKTAIKEVKGSTFETIADASEYI